MRSFQSQLSEFDRRGIRVVAISVDSPEANNDHRRKLGLSFPLLSDEKRDVARRFGVLHPSGGSDGADIARPAEFLIDSGGIVRWVNLTQSITARARPDEVLQAFDAAK